MFRRITAAAFLTVFAAAVFAAETDSRRADLDQLLRVLPKSLPWEAWLHSSAELPPDISALPTMPFLPDPLTFENGTAVKTKAEWIKRRAELLKLFQRYVTGTIPPAPRNIRVAEEQSREEDGCRVEERVLEFGPEHRARLHVELIVPKGKGPFPVFITQETHRGWARVAVSRGYIACIYAGADSRDDTAAWVELWPDYDWTKLTRRAWAASRCIDYLYTRADVDKAHIALTGHSRNGKTSIIGAAFDERIKAVISSSSGAGGACSFRFFSERQAGEGIELITRSFHDWLHPRLRFFAGREEKLPIDMPELIACVAPRAFLFSTALNDDVESTWAIEQSCSNARRAYNLLSAPGAISLLYREGPHATDAHDIERYMDWLDATFGRAGAALISAPMFPTYSDWLKVSGEKINVGAYKPVSSETPRSSREATLKAVRWMLGEEPPNPTGIPGAYGSEPQYLSVMLGRNAVPFGLARRSFNFGDYLAGNLYFPTNADRGGKKLPVIVWLHPISVSNGYVPGYRRGEPPHLALARAGFAVFTFDQIGNGGRIEEVRDFYARHPHWSLLGKTVADTRAALDALARFDFVDTNRIWLVGFDTGAGAALHAAALDSRVAGVAAVGGFSLMRPGLSNRGRPIAAQFQRWYPLLPRLGAFAGYEDRIPYDHRELVDAIAPRPVLLFAPEIDTQVDATDLKRAYALQRNAQFNIVEDYNRFGPEMQHTVIEKLRTAVAGR